MLVSFRPVAALALGAILVACGGAGREGDPGGGASSVDGTLFDRLGGMDGVRALVDDLTGRLAADETIQHFFAQTDFRRFKARLVVQLCALSGGPCRYRGPSMAEAHRAHSIRAVHFDAFMDDLEAALAAAQVNGRDRAELVARLRRLEPEIVR